MVIMLISKSGFNYHKIVKNPLSTSSDIRRGQVRSCVAVEYLGRENVTGNMSFIN